VVGGGGGGLFCMLLDLRVQDYNMIFNHLMSGAELEPHRWG
jgi:hypothetical protein